MRVYALLPTIFATSAMLSALAAQEPRTSRGMGTVIMPRAGAFGMVNAMTTGAPPAVIGVSTDAGATSRDTLGLFVSSVRDGSPAEKAGIQEGDRIASVNGVSLKLSPADVGDGQMASVLSRRLSRVLDKVKPGDEVDLRVYSNGQTKSVKVKSMSPADLYAAPARRNADRATIGVDLAVNGSARDSLGVFVMGVEDGGPAAKAGIQEGSRIASINGVDLRVKDRDDDQGMMGQVSDVNRLSRELSRVKPGDEVELRVVYDGQTRTVKVKTVRQEDLPRRARVFRIESGDNVAMPEVMARIAMPQIQDGVLRALGTARAGMGGSFGALGPFGRMSW